MEQVTIKKKMIIGILSAILALLISYIVYSKYFEKEGLSLKKIGKSFKKIGKKIKDPFDKVKGPLQKITNFFKTIAKVFVWIGKVAVWTGATVAALFYYIGNIFTGCVLFYFFDMILGTIWFILLLIASAFGQGKNFLKLSRMISNVFKQIDKTFYDFTGMRLFKYSDKTVKKCYKLKFKKFPKFPKL
jgi:phage-related protein